MNLKFALVFGFAALTAQTGKADTLYVSGSASSTNTTCTYAAPCRSVGSAIEAASPGDTVLCLSAPLFSGMRIEKSITVDCRNVGAVIRDGSVLSGLSVGVFINIPVSSNDPLRTVKLRGFRIDAGYPGSSGTGGRYFNRGIDILSASAVYLEDFVITDVVDQAIYDRRSGGQTKLFVKDSTIAGTAGPGIVAASQAVGATVLDNVSLLNNGYGIAAATGNNVFISRSTISGNTIAGVHADAGAQIAVTGSTLSHNSTHVNAFGRVRLRDNDLQYGNVAVQGGNAVSMGENRFAGNASAGAAPTPASGAPADISN